MVLSANWKTHARVSFSKTFFNNILEQILINYTGLALFCNYYTKWSCFACPSSTCLNEEWLPSWTAVNITYMLPGSYSSLFLPHKNNRANYIIYINSCCGYFISCCISFTMQHFLLTVKQKTRYLCWYFQFAN